MEKVGSGGDLEPTFSMINSAAGQRTGTTDGQLGDTGWTRRVLAAGGTSRSLLDAYPQALDPGAV